MNKSQQNGSFTIQAEFIDRKDAAANGEVNCLFESQYSIIKLPVMLREAIDGNKA